MRIKYFLLSGIVALCIACGTDYELRNSIFIYDNDSPGLPRYSEQGYNTFGSYYDRLPFVSSEVTPLEVSVEEGKTLFSFNGRIVSSPYNTMSIQIRCNDFDPETYTDLLSLNHISIDLTDPAYTIVVLDSDGEHTAEILNGTFTFERVQNLLVDKELFQVILSGTFNFQAIVNNDPVTVSDGRFDVGVGDHNFYRY